MQDIYKNILKMFPEFSWKSLNQTQYPRLRFYFDKMNTKCEPNGRILLLATTIISLLSTDDKVFFGATFFASKEKHSKSFLQKLKKLKLDFIVKDINNQLCERKLIQVDEDMGFYYYFGGAGPDQIYSINKHIINSDFLIGNGQIQLGCYLFFPKSEILVNLYDDRGMDIISTNRANLEKIKDKWGKIIPIEIF